MEILLSKCRMKNILVMNFSKPSLFGSDVDKFKLETKIKTLKSIVDEKQVGINQSYLIIKCISKAVSVWSA